ncbi:MAG: hypothetical protein EBS71_09625 [Actinobacteria bacterium]|nr:hypothetical protein [Actinomycetota bacterium]
MYDTWRLGNSKSGAASVVLVDRLMGLLALTAYSLVTVFFAGELIQSVTTLPLLVLGATSILTILAWIIFLAPRTSLERIASLSGMIWPGLGRITRKITSALSAFHGRKALLLRAFSVRRSRHNEWCIRWCHSWASSRWLSGPSRQGVRASTGCSAMRWRWATC